ncbi:MAG: nitronate monooxygenase [Blastocatellia bacterium]
MTHNLPASITAHTTLPVIAAPMFLVSGIELVTAACKAGVIGTFPVLNARTSEALDDWMQRITTDLGDAQKADPAARIAPWGINLVTHRTNTRLQADLDLTVKYRTPLVITSLGSPAPAVEAVHSYGGLVFSDVINVSFAKKAAQTGIDGLVLVCAGAGGHAGTLSPFAFLKAVREFFDGIIVLAGALSSGRDIRAAQVLGADLVYFGTSFIATTESLAPPDYQQMLVDATMDDLIYTNAFSGAYANMLKPSIVAAGIDPATLQPKDNVDFSHLVSGETKAWKHIWSAGQGVSFVRQVQPTAELVAQLRREYAEVVAEERRGDAWTTLLG